MSERMTAESYKGLIGGAGADTAAPKAKRKPPAAHEFENQAALFAWARNAAVRRNTPELALMSASLNGVQLSKAQAGKAKAAGMLEGEWDIRLPVARGGYIGLIIEMKYGKNCLTEKQREYGRLMADAGHKCVVCWSWDEARAAIEQYLFFYPTTTVVLRGLDFS